MGRYNSSGAMYEYVRSIITRPPQDRTPEQIDNLVPWFTRMMRKIDKSMDMKVLRDIIMNCGFTTRPKDNIMINEGERGDCYYIIMRGSVSVFVNQTALDNAEQNADEIQYKDTDERASPSYNQRAVFPQFYNDQGELDRTKLGMAVTTLHTGESFGELALLDKDCIRKASVLADETTDMVTVPRELYNRCLKAAQMAEFDEKIKFVETHQLFHNWQKKFKKSVAMSLTKEVVPFGEAIVKQGQIVQGLYFLTSGSASVLIDPKQHKHQFSQFYPLQDPQEREAQEELATEQIQRRKRKDKKTSSLDNLNPPVTTPMSAQRVKERMKKPIEVTVVAHNEVIGDLELSLELRVFVAGVQCREPCHVFFLNAKNCERLIARRNKPTLAALRRHAAAKLAVRRQRLPQVPLLHALAAKFDERGNLEERGNKRRAGGRGGDGGGDLYDVAPHRGPLIDQYGPGTIFHRNKQREKALRSRSHPGGNFRGATTLGFGLAPGGSKEGENNAPIPARATTPPPQRVAALGVSEGALVTERSVLRDRQPDGNVVLTDMDGSGSPSMRSTSIETTFRDYPSSDVVLSMLEERLTSWYLSGPQPTTGAYHAQKIPRPAKLRRVHNVHDIKPGKKIYLIKKQPRGIKVAFEGGAEDSNNKPFHQDRIAPRNGHPEEDETRSEEVLSRCPTTSHPTSSTSSSNSPNPNPSHSQPNQRYVFKLEKRGRAGKRTYTASEYAMLKKQLQARQRSWGYGTPPV